MTCLLQDPSYLCSVIETIADPRYERSSASVHILLDAYATFVNRVRSQSQLLDACDTLPPALEPLRTHKDNVVRALRRDVSLAHADPFSTLSGAPHSSPFAPNIKTDAKRYARDSSSLCQHALCTLTTIFRFPVFYLAFSEPDLSSLFADILDIALAEQLLVLNKAKTYSLSLWALGCHRLPLTVVDSRQGDVYLALQRSLDGARQPDNVVLDGLKAISHTIERHPSAFLDLLFPLLPHVTTSLNCKSLAHRLHSSIALGKFANALVHQLELSLMKWRLPANYIMPFLESSCEEPQLAPEAMDFSSMTRIAFSAESHVRHTDGPWMLCVLASLIVLCGPALYRKPMVLRFILQSLARALTDRRSVVRALHPHVWRCFIWTFGRMLLSTEGVDPTLISSAFYVIKQEVSGGIGVALASVLLSDRTQSDKRGERVSQALSIIRAMARTECKHTRREAFTFLQALTNDSEARQQILQNMYEVPASVLLNGAIIRAEWDSLPSIIQSIPRVLVSMRWPEEEDIAPHYKALLVAWKHFASQTDGKHLDVSQLTPYVVRTWIICTLFKPGLVDMWSSILLVCSHWFESGQNSTATTEMLRHTATIIIKFLPSVTIGNYQPDWGSWNVRDQLCSLTVIDQLWSAMRRIFVTADLADVAELILTSILRYAFHVLDPGVRTLWGRLCVSLMTTASPSFLRNIHNPTTPQLVIHTQRGLWGVVATSLSSSESGLDWKELVRFLAIPVCAWALSEPELGAWEALLRTAITGSRNSAEVNEHIVSQIFRGKEVETWDSIIPILGFMLACAHEHGSSPANEFLSTVDVCLTICYNQARHTPGMLRHSLELLNVIRCAIVSTPGNVMHMLRALCSSLCLWIEDHAEVMSDDEFNSVAVSLYCEALKALEVLPLSILSLQETADFLASAFCRVPTPAIAPFAFEKFWRATYHGQSQFCNNLPPKIKSCLSCFVAAYGGDLADGLSLTTESQSQSISNDSQVYSPPSHRDQDVAPYEHLPMLARQDDTSFLLTSPDEDAFQLTVLHQLQEYSSRMDGSSVDDSLRSVNDPRILSSPTFLPRSHSPEKNHLATLHTLNQKRKLVDIDDVPQKRSQTSRGALRSLRKLESEPATRDVTPVDVPRMNSVPPKKRKVFDGVEVPIFRETTRWKTVQRVGTSGRTINTGQVTAVSGLKTPRCAQRKSGVSQSSIGSEEDDLDWENFRVDETSSEADIDRPLADAHPSSPPRTSPHGTPERRRSPRSTRPLHSEFPSGPSLPTAMSQSKSSPLASTARSLQRAKATLERLDALRDIHSAVADGASQIPLPELMQATILVHQIGTVLTEQMDKKMRERASSHSSHGASHP